MHRSLRLLILGAAAIAGSPLTALAAPPRDRDPAAVFKDLDRNQDGQITDDEVPEESRKLHKRLVRLGDADKNGHLSLDEFTSALAGNDDPAEAATDAEQSKRPRRKGGNEQRRQRFEQMHERLLKMDANGDGKIEQTEVPEEFRGRFESILDRLDSDGDDVLSKDEIVAGDRAIAERFGDRPGRPDGPPGGPDGPPGGPDGKGRPDGPPGGPDGKARPGRGPGAMLEKLKEADANGDGKIELSEVPDQFKEGFERILDQLDNDGDDALSQDEIKGAKEMAQRMRGGPPGGPGGPPRDPAAMWQRLQQADKDGDGKLSKDEAPPPLQDRFAQLDANGDGYIEQEEMKQAGERMRKQMQKRAKKASKGKAGKPGGAKKKPGKPGRPGAGPKGPPPDGPEPPADVPAGV